jgi:hypothetical protein
MPKYKVEMEKCSSVKIGDKDYPVLIHYLRKNSHQTVPTTSKEKGRPFGVIVALDKDKIGWSICHNVEPWSREEAIKRAAGRAMRGYDHWITEFKDYTTEFGDYVGKIEGSGLPKLEAVLAGIKQMKVRAEHYYLEPKMI